MKVKRKIFSNKATLALPYTLNLRPRGHEFIGKGHDNSAFSFFPPSESFLCFFGKFCFFLQLHKFNKKYALLNFNIVY